MKTEDEIRMSLVIGSTEHTPEQLDSIVGMRCDEYHLKGSPILQSGRTHKENYWEVYSGLPRDASFQEHLTALLARVSPFAENIRSLSGSARVELSCVLYLREAQGPDSWFDSSAVKAIADLGASIDLDIYLLPTSDE